MTVQRATYKLPNELFFRRLVENEQTIKRVIFHDPTCQVSADYTRLLSDIVILRERLYNALPASAFDERGLIREELPYICTLATGNYEYVVAAFAILSIGAAIVPLAPAVLPQEAHYFLAKTRSQLLLTSTRALELGLAIREYVCKQGQAINVMPIRTLASDSTLPSQIERVTIDEDLVVPAARPSLILFTSGSTGPPKGVVHSRRFFSAGYFSDPNDVFLTHRPVHWIGGSRSIINLVISGTKQEVIEANEVAIWERLKEGGITMLCCVIPLWCKLMNYYNSTLSRLPAAELELYVKPARSLRVTRIGGAAPQPNLLKFWREHIGIQLEVTYGCTETGGPGMVTDTTCDRSLECSLGKPEKGVTVKLSSEGEILIKNSMQFSCYLDSPEATELALTEDGFFRTGDNGQLIGDEYVIEGRASTDFVRFHGFKVPVVEVEMRILELSFVQEACIVSVPDAEASTRVAALVRFSTPLASESNLRGLREALTGKLANFKMPTALRVLQDGEAMPVTFTGKVLRKEVIRTFFPSEGGYQLPSEVEMWDLKTTGQAVGHQAWDWAGLQGC